MNASIADILQRARAGQALAEPAGERAAEDAEDEFPCYGRLRGVRQAAFMLELRLATGDADAFDYGLLGRVRLDPSAGLMLWFANGTVTVRGRNLRPVFEAALARRLAWVREADEPARVGRDPGATVVTAIEVETGSD